MWTWDRLVADGKAFFSSGLFYMLVGCAFLYTAYGVSLGNRAHSAFVFLLAIVGVALVLYGTGTNAAGEGGTGNIKVFIAGGAGVLALVLGFGVVERGPQIGSVFKRTMDYGVLKVQVSKESSTGLTASLADFDARARSGSSRPLHLWNDGETIEVLVPIDETGVSDVKIYLTARPGAREIRDKIVETYDLPWNDDKQAKPEAGFTNEIVKAITREVDLSTREGVPVVQPATASNRNPAPLTISPQ